MTNGLAAGDPGSPQRSLYSTRQAMRPLLVLGMLSVAGLACAADEVLRPRVPADQLQAARAVANPLPATPEHLESGRALYHGKAFCGTCHGQDGKGFGDVPGLRGALPRNFTDKAWQAARTDGELFWILEHGSPGTDMAPFIPLVLTEEEAWQVLLYVRSLGR